MAATFKRVEVDGMVIRATKGDAPPGWAVGGGRQYPVEVNGVLRGLLIHTAQGGWRSSPKWNGFRLLSSNWREASEIPNQWLDDPIFSGSHDVEWPLRQIGLATQRGEMPSLEERDAWIAVERRKIAEHAAKRAAEDAVREAQREAWKARAAREAQERQEAADHERSDISEALTSIRDRASVGPVVLSNFEVDVLGRLIKVYAPKEVSADAAS